MEGSSGVRTSKRRRKKLFELNLEDESAVDSLFESSGSEYNPGSDFEGCLADHNYHVSVTASVLLGYVGYHLMFY